MKTVNPVSKKCWVCNNTKFLNQWITLNQLKLIRILWINMPTFAMSV